MRTDGHTPGWSTVAAVLGGVPSPRPPWPSRRPGFASTAVGRPTAPGGAGHRERGSMSGVPLISCVSTTDLLAVEALALSEHRES